MKYNVVGFRERLEKALFDSNMTLEELALLSGVSRQSLWTYRYTEKLPRISALVGICKALGCSSDWLLGMTNEEPVIKCKKILKYPENIAVDLMNCEVLYIDNNVKLTKEFIMENCDRAMPLIGETASKALLDYYKMGFKCTKDTRRSVYLPKLKRALVGLYVDNIYSCFDGRMTQKLEMNGIFYLDDLRDMSDAKILSMRMCGKTTLNTIRRAI